MPGPRRGPSRGCPPPPPANFPAITAEAMQRAIEINAEYERKQKAKADARAAKAAERAAAAGRPLPAARQPISQLSRPTGATRTNVGAGPSSGRPLTAGAVRRPQVVSQIGRTASAAVVNRPGTSGGADPVSFDSHIY